MKSINLTKEELATMSYDDVAYKILENNQKKMKIQDLFKEVIRLMDLSNDAFENHFPFVGKADVTIMFGEPIYLDKLSKEEKKFIGSYSQKVIQENLDKIHSSMLK